MKKVTVLLLLVFVSLSSFAQKNELKFDRKVYECENEWVTLPLKEKDSVHILGLVYFDPFKGYVLNVMNYFKIDNLNGNYVREQDQVTGSIIHVVTNKEINFAVISKSRYGELNIEKINASINRKRYDEKNADDLVNKGAHLNHFGASEKAAEVLESAYKINKKAKNLVYELSYSYNANNQYEKAIKLLKETIKEEPKVAVYYKELGYSYLSQMKIGEAETVYIKGIEVSQNKSEKSEMSYNLAANYFNIKNREKFNEWAAITQKFADANSQEMKNIELMKKELK